MTDESHDTPPEKPYFPKHSGSSPKSNFGKPEQPAPAGFAPMEGGCTIPNIINKILKNPLSIVHDLEMSENGRKITFLLFLMMIGCYAVFGFVLGTFSWDDQLWAAPLKITGGILFSGLICLPSLYIFSCMGGMEGKVVTVVGLLFLVIGLAGLLLIGFAPVVWLFSASSQSVIFLGFLAIVIWLIALGFCITMMFRATYVLGVENPSHLVLWCGIFLLVTLQMTTTLRPIVGTPDSHESQFNFKEKKGFITHWTEQLNTPSKDWDEERDQVKPRR